MGKEKSKKCKKWNIKCKKDIGRDLLRKGGDGNEKEKEQTGGRFFLRKSKQAE